MGEGEDGGMKRWLAFLPFLALAWALELRVTASLVVDLFPQAVVVERFTRLPRRRPFSATTTWTSAAGAGCG